MGKSFKLHFITVAMCLLTKVAAFGQMNAIRPIFELKWSHVESQFDTRTWITSDKNPFFIQFTLGPEGRAIGEVEIFRKENQERVIDFRGFIRDNHLVDSAIWYKNRKPWQITYYSNECCEADAPKVVSLDIPDINFNGIKEGKEYLFYDDENVRQIENYKLGIIHGKQFYYGSDGQLITVKNYHYGVLNDSCLVECNRPKSDVQIYSNGNPSGVWKFYDDKGEVLKEHHYLKRNDSMVYFEPGKGISVIFSKYNPRSNYNEVFEYNENKTLIKNYYLYNGRFHDMYYEYDDRGRKKKTISYNYGILDGIYREYYKGKLIVKGAYTGGKKSGYWTTYSKYGGITDHENYGKHKPLQFYDHPDTHVESIPDNDIKYGQDFQEQINPADIRFFNEKYGKINRVLKKYDSIPFSVAVSQEGEIKITVEDDRLKKKQKETVLEFLNTSIQLRSPMTFGRSNTNFVSEYQLKLHPDLK